MVLPSFGMKCNSLPNYTNLTLTAYSLISNSNFLEDCVLNTNVITKCLYYFTMNLNVFCQPSTNLTYFFTVAGLGHVFINIPLQCSTISPSTQLNPWHAAVTSEVIQQSTFSEKTSNMESADQYIKTARYRDTDQWSVFFSNKNELSVEEIDKITSEFVTKKKINQTGNSSGICFINLFSYEDAVKCVEGLQGHDLIQLKKQFKDRGESKKNGTKNDDMNKSDFNYDEMYNSDYKHDEINKNGSKNDEIKYDDKESCISNYSDNTKKSSGTVNDVITDLKAKKVIATDTYDYLIQEFQEKKCVEVKPKMPELVLKKNVSNTAIPKDIIVEPEYSTEEIPKLIEHVEAEELIIANIHEDYGTNYILHLLEKYQPICASSVKVSERYALRYCHVFFTSNQHINEVKQKFDKFELGTKNLIVLYVNRLKGILSF